MGIGLSIQNLRKTFPGGVEAVADLTLEVPAGQFLSIIGPSGCGKSTLLRMIANLDAPTAGSINRTIASPADGIAYVFQDAHLLPWRRVLTNVTLPLELAGISRSEREDRAQAMLKQVGLSEAIRRYPAQLSGGMRMRVSLARALITQPELLLLDEPFAALDEITRQQLDEQLRQLWHDRGMTVIFVTHSINEATYLADRAVVFSMRPASIVLDRDLSQSLPGKRHPEIRTSQVFVDEMRRLFEALRGAE